MSFLQYIRKFFKRKVVLKPPVAKKKYDVTIGLDFGTSTTKCVINLEGFERGKDKYLAFSFRFKGSPKEGTLCVPTAIGVTEDSLFFGFLAENLPQDNIIRSFKMAIPCIDSKWGSYESLFMLHNKPGYFQILGHEFSAVDLSALYLAVIIRQIKSRLSRYVGDNINLQAYMNMAAPLDQLIQYYEMAETATEEVRREMSLENAPRDTRVSKRYMDLGQWCLRLSNRSHNPWQLQDALIALKEVKASVVVPREESPASVVPETLAATTAYINRPRTRSGRFITFDVGAGTTDITVFWLEKHDGVIKPWYYAAGSLHVGMDDIDRSLSEVLIQITGHSLRQKREHLEFTTGGIREYSQSFEPVLRQIQKHKDRMFGRAYQKETKRQIWGTRNKALVTFLMLGGGCQSDVMKDFGRLSVWRNVLGAPSTETLNLDLAERVLLPDCTETSLSDVPSLSEQGNLLVVAEGLANKIVDIPDYGITSEPLFAPPVIPWDAFVKNDWWR